MSQSTELNVIDNKSEARAYIYKWLQEKFVTPNGEKYTEFDFSTLREALAYIGMNNLEAPILEMEETLNQNYSEKDAVLEFCRLFYGPQKIPCPPFGSYYVDTMIPMNKSAVMALEEYLNWGLVLSENTGCFPDHIAIELEFIYYLAAKEEDAREQRDYLKAIELVDAQQQFLAKHLIKWVPQFVEKTVETTNLKLFSGLVKFINEFLKEDYRLLNDIKEQYKQSMN
ncbi:molecular chaperone TorD family protein [Anaerobacillus sp. CMMVII]|uniref:TorD/DmsD family molecular chaperone n=1 Tax=Anaerobacillus sp. CMMVII TaxID=2755588 RepID=UPI0021B785CF|nr:molecular chaperone TorD family protein [Anaerobacillus sp. CMMVII]MCT8137017.1 molecular chaperone TorD family protein [Anaerobacillus sp. CMMVII]